MKTLPAQSAFLGIEFLEKVHEAPPHIRRNGTPTILPHTTNRKVKKLSKLVILVQQAYHSKTTSFRWISPRTAARSKVFIKPSPKSIPLTLTIYMSFRSWVC